jgi:hypothetical protein
LRDQPWGRQAQRLSGGGPGTSPGGRFAVTDIIVKRRIDVVADRDATESTACIAGALTGEEYTAGLETAGFVAIEIEETRRIHERASSAIVRARKSETALTRDLSLSIEPSTQARARR